MLEIVPYKAEHGLEIIAQNTKQPKLQLGAETEQWAKIKEQKGPGLTGIYDGRLIGCGGLEIFWKGFAEAWCILISDIENYSFAPRTLKNHLLRWKDEYKLYRIQMVLRTDFPAGIRLAHWLGFRYEAFHEMFQPDGTDAWIYVLLDRRNLKKWKP